MLPPSLISFFNIMNLATTSSHISSVKTSVTKAVHVPKSSTGASKLSNTKASANHKDSCLSSEASTQSALSTSSHSSFPPRLSRSSSFTSPSPPPARKRSASQADQISSEIWKMFGKDRDAYMKRPVSSDDETDDMEADAESLWREERKRCCNFFFFSKSVLNIFQLSRGYRRGS
jgi:protein SPT2